MGASWDEAVAALTGPGGRFEIVEREVRGRRTRVFANAPSENSLTCSTS